MSDGGLTVLQGMALDMVASGASPRQIAEALGIKPHEAVKLSYDLLDKEIITDADQARKLQVYRLQKLIEAIWQRTIENGGVDDIRNVRELMADMNVLLALNKEIDEKQHARMHSFQLAGYMVAMQGLIAAFKMIAPTAMKEEEWPAWAAEQLEVAQEHMKFEIEE